MLQFLVFLVLAWPVIRLALAVRFPDLLKRFEGARAQVQLEARQGAGVIHPEARRISQALAREAGIKVVTRVFEGDTVNAVALPNHRVYLWRGIVNVCGDDRDMLAGVIAHEIGHIRRDHFIERIGSLAVAQYALGVFVPRVFRGALGQALGSIVANGFSRVQEEEADATAVALMRGAGFDPEGLARVFERLAELGGRTGLLGSHPDPRARAIRVRKLARLGR